MVPFDSRCLVQGTFKVELVDDARNFATLDNDQGIRLRRAGPPVPRRPLRATGPAGLQARIETEVRRRLLRVRVTLTGSRYTPI